MSLAAAREVKEEGAGLGVDSPRITLDLRGGDAWVWRKLISGTCADCSPGTAIALHVNGVPVDAEREGVAFRAVASFEPSENEVVAIATMPDGSEERSAAVRYTVRLEPRPTACLRVRIEGERVVCDGRGSEPSEYGGAPIEIWRLSPRESNPVPVDLSEDEPGVWCGAIPVVDGDYSISLKVEDGKDRTDTATSSFVVKDGQARAPDPVHERAAWIADAVIYGVVPRNFDPPGFKGVTARLDDLADLGVTALWFSPITCTLPGHFGYEVTDYFEVQPEYGTKDDFRELVKAAHARDMRVLMDFVPNHTSVEHPYFQDALANGQGSTYWNYYDRQADGKPTHYFTWIHLPNLNYDNPEVARFMMEAVTYWVREFGIDGFRIDAVWGIKERNPEWLAAFLAEMSRIKPDLLLIAEASARDNFYFEQGFDAVYDWSEELGQWAWGGVWDGNVPIGEAMVDVLTNGGRGYHADALIMRFLNNNDTGPRFLTTHGVDFYRTALAMLLTLPGLPCLFTGDEVGAEYQPYAQSGPIDWTDHHGLREDTTRLITLRHGTPALHSRAWRPLAAEPVASLFAYLRTNDAGEEPVVVLLNFSSSAFEATVDLPEPIAMDLGDGDLTDLWSGETVPGGTGGRVTISIPGWGYRFLTRANDAV